MAISRKKFLVAGVLLSLALGSACDTTNNPTGPETSGAAPAIATLTPSSPSTSSVAQSLSMSGANFRTGLSITLRAPGGASTTYTGGAVTVQSSSSLSVSATLDTEGAWAAVIKNVDGLESTAFPFTVVAPGGDAPAPVILSVSPNPVTAGPNAQPLSINGADFRAGATVTITSPTGTNVPVTISGQDTTLLSVSATIETAGTYTVTVRNLDGTTSAAFSLTVNPPPGLS